jgi:repressor LexA
LGRLPHTPEGIIARGLTFRLLFAKIAGMALTKRQRQVYDYIAEFVQRQGYSPSFEEIGTGLGLSSLATVHKHISNLERKGLLRRDYNRSRSLDILAPRGRMKTAMQAAAAAAGMAQAGSASLPLVGRIAAGQPVETLENPESISLADITGSRDVFVLEVRGDSMQDEHIVSGDYVLVEKMKTARNGEIVVALVDNNETTLKRFYKEGDKILLQPANSKMQPIVLPAASVQVQGRVIGILRKY